MKFSLPPELARQVSEKVAAGRYTSASEMVREGLELLLAVEDGGLQGGANLDADIRLGLDQLDRGEGVDGEDSRQRLLKRFAAPTS